MWLYDRTPEWGFTSANQEVSWQRGSNENFNGLLRQYFPKGTDLCRYGMDELQAVARALNNRPRKTLGWRTAAEVFCDQLAALKQTAVATIG
jgi:IS30 family transposase